MQARMVGRKKADEMAVPSSNDGRPMFAMFHPSLGINKRAIPYQQGFGYQSVQVELV